jgi:2'-5' RNA ligase
MDVQRIEVGDQCGFRWDESGTVYEFAAGDDAGMQLAFKKAVRDGVLAGETPVGETARRVARAMAGHVGVRKDAGGDLIVAWWLPSDLAEALAVPGGVAPEDLHLTILYLGDPEKVDADAVLAVTKLFTMYRSPIKGSVGGYGCFVGPEDEDIHVALVDCPDLEWIRRALCEDLSCRAGIYVEEGGHGYVPHITLAYTPKGTAVERKITESIPFEIANITVAAGSLRIGFDLGGNEYAEEPVAYYAKRAFEAAGIILEPTDVAKAGRVLSAKNLAALTQMHEALGKVIDAETGRRVAAPELDPEDEAAKPAKEKETKKDADVQGSGSRFGLDPSGGQGQGEATAGEAGEEEALTYEVTKAVDEERYTLGPLYAPNRKDAHGEWTDADTLQKGVWEYVRESSDTGRRLNLQHGDDGEVTVGEWVEVVVWPYEHTIKVAVPGEEERELTMPAGTVYMGVIWDEDAWPLVKAKKLTGYSLGGKAVKVQMDAELPNMGDKTH